MMSNHLYAHSGGLIFMEADLTKADCPTMGRLTTWYVKAPPVPDGVVGEYIDRMAAWQLG